MGSERYKPIVSVDHSIGLLESDIARVRVGGTVTIFCGKGNLPVYGNSRFEEVINEVVHNKDAKIKIITGPFLMEQNGSHPFLRLSEDPKLRGKVNLLHRLVHAVDGHFRTVETDEGLTIHTEFPHPLENEPISKHKSTSESQLVLLRHMPSGTLEKDREEGYAEFCLRGIRVWNRNEMFIRRPYLVTADDFAQLCTDVLTNNRGLLGSGRFDKFNQYRNIDYMNPAELRSLPGFRLY